MTQSNTQSSLPGNTPLRSFIPDLRFPDLRAAFTTGLTVAALLTASIGARAQATDAAPATPPATQTDAAPAAPAPTPGMVISNQPTGKTRKQKEDKVVVTKDTKKEDKVVKKDNPLEGMDAKLPDKALYDKAMDAIKHGRFDVARLDLQTLLNTYQDSQFQMRAKIAIADSWYKEGGTAALTQAEQEYRDFIVFYPNVPEAAEAQMRIGDIYFREMDKPDRDNSKAVHAEEEYRLMLQQFPDSTRVPEAAQRLRVVQESLATADADVAAFYSTHQNWPATIARYQTVADTYPLYSHMDDVLVGLGDAYEAEARVYRALRLPEAAKARLVKLYDDQAAAAYTKVVLEHSASAHVEDARDRLAAMNLPIPTPTPEQVAASAALENSRGQYTLSNRVKVFVLHQADTVPAATVGNPPLEDPKPTYASQVVKQTVDEFNAALRPAASTPAPTGAAPAPAADSSAPANAPAPASAPLNFQDVPSGSNGSTPAPAINTAQPAAVSAPSSGGSGMGIEIVQPSSDAPAAPVTQPPGSAPPAFPGTETTPAAQTPAATPAQPRSSDNYGLAPVGPATTVLAPVEKAPSAPDAINEVPAGSQPPAKAATAATNGKKPKPACDKDDESCSNHKKKKGLAKLNPF
jgi:outer membrane protein assembly factor BamD